jgi:CYTH domain-containing protein
MPWEIERRFLVRISASTLEGLGEGRRLRQGYLRSGRPSVRIRTGEARGAVLTCKEGSGIRRREVEAVVPDEVAEALFRAAGDRVIEKIRWRVGAWELDRFLGPLEGLELMEVEVEREGSELPEPPSGVQVLREVTHDKRFVSGHLARLQPKAQRKLVARAYREVSQ